MRILPNKVGAGNGAMTLILHLARLGRAVPDLARWTKMKVILLFLPLACLVHGCSSSERASESSHFADVTLRPQSSEATAPQLSSSGEGPAQIHVGGEFKRPGAYPWTNGMRLKDAFDVAGGFTVFASKLVALTRPGEPRQHYFKWSTQRPLTNNPALKPGDSVYAPIVW